MDATSDSVDAKAATASTEGEGKGAGAWRVLLVAIVGAEFMLQVDGTIVNVALPTLREDLGLDVAAAAWVVNGFLVAFGGLLLLAGRLADVFGHRRLFLAGVALVGVASLIAGLAPGFGVLLAGRVLQGAGAALAGPAGLALLTTSFEGVRRERAFGLYSTVTGLGAAFGMVLGGVLTWAGDWRWSLLVNVPFAAAIVVVGARVLPPVTEPPVRRPAGAGGALLATAALVALVYGPVRASSAGWSDAWTVAVLAGAAIMVAVFAVVDRRAAQPLLPGRVFGERRLGGFVALVLTAAVLTGFLFYVTQYLDAVFAMSPLRTGFAILPFGLALSAAVRLSGPVVGRLAPRGRAVLGLGIVLLAMLWLTRLGSGSRYATDVLPPIALLGVGVGVALVPINMMILTTADPADAGVTAGLLQVALTVGGALGVAVLLLPATAGGRGLGENISTLFAWNTAIVGVALASTLAFWFGPGTRRR